MRLPPPLLSALTAVWIMLPLFADGALLFSPPTGLGVVVKAAVAIVVVAVAVASGDDAYGSTAVL